MKDLLAPVRGRLALACLLQALSAVAGVVPFVAVAEIGAELVGDGPADDDRVRAIAMVAIAGLGARALLALAAGTVTHLADSNLQLDLRRRLADRLERVPLGWFTDRSAGEVKKVVQDDVSAMHHLVAHSLLDLTTAAVTPLVVLAYLISVDWRFSLVALVPLVVGLAVYRRQMSGYGEKMQGYSQSLTDVNAAAVEFVQGISVVKAFGQAGRAHRRFLDAANRFVDFFWERVRGLLALSSASEVVLAPLAGLTLVLTAGTLFVSQDWLDVLDLLPFTLLALALTAPVMTLSHADHELQIASQAAGRVTGLLATPVLAEPADPVAPAGHRVVYEGVRFSYDGETEVLAGVDLVLEPGTVTALVGPSGSGKTTLAKLLPRFWDPTGGRVTLGGADLRDIAPRELYRHVGFVFQDVQLLRTTVRDNIRLARPDADDARVEAVARAAQVHDRIGELPRGYDSVVGEDAHLSGGEAQRISIARALLADTPILALDEATAFADPESETAIQDALSRLVAERTLLVIAHRLQTIAAADQIVVLDGGRVADAGTHTELLARGGRYAEFWRQRTRAQGWRLATTT
jgi:ATP-binding cassette, subfamily B, bacterial IrtA/YbtP